MAETVTLATLIRGKSYKQFYNGEYVEFKRNVPREIDEILADELEAMIETIATEDAEEVIEVDRFRVERNQKPLAEVEGDVTRKRLRLVTEEVSIKPRRAPVLRSPPKGFKAKASASG